MVVVYLEERLHLADAALIQGADMIECSPLMPTSAISSR
jgi:hypothetical protein